MIGACHWSIQDSQLLRSLIGQTVGGFPLSRSLLPPQYLGFMARRLRRSVHCTVKFLHRCVSFDPAQDLQRWQPLLTRRGHVMKSNDMQWMHEIYSFKLSLANSTKKSFIWQLKQKVLQTQKLDFPFNQLQSYLVKNMSFVTWLELAKNFGLITINKGLKPTTHAVDADFSGY